MRKAEQIGLPLTHETRYTPDAFHPSAPSATARGLLESTSSWPAGKLMIVGEPASGKTHLLNIWAGREGAHVIDAGDLPSRSAMPLAVDRADAVAGDAAREEALFHLHNNMASAGLPLLLAARKVPRDWGIGLPDLKSRMDATTVARIGPPDDATLTAILEKLMTDRQLTPAPNLAPYLLNRMARSYSETARIVDALDTLSLVEKRAITTALAARVLDDDAK